MLCSKIFFRIRSQGDAVEVTVAQKLNQGSFFGEAKK